jgi:hypothetical protein
MTWLDLLKWLSELQAADQNEQALRALADQIQKNQLQTAWLKW